jgi:hypothetical protein
MDGLKDASNGTEEPVEPLWTILSSTARCRCGRHHFEGEQRRSGQLLVVGGRVLAFGAREI